MSDPSIEIRQIEPGDAEPLRAIYNHYVAKTAITFDVEPRGENEWRSWMDRFAGTGRHQCFVALSDAVAVGWASSLPLKDRAAYETSVETSVYLAPGRSGSGFGRRLYARLFDALAHEDVHRAFAAITAPNPSSVRLHEMFGFRLLGRFPEVGRKFGGYHDVDWYWRPVPLHETGS
jgi:phosphinothricin acetyltransferase